jgi:hypothetical protein
MSRTSDKAAATRAESEKAEAEEAQKADEAKSEARSESDEDSSEDEFPNGVAAAENRAENSQSNPTGSYLEPVAQARRASGTPSEEVPDADEAEEEDPTAASVVQTHVRTDI